MGLEAAEASLESAKKGYEAATNDMNDAKKRYEDAKAELEGSTPSITVSRLEKENNRLQIQVCQLESKISSKIRDLEESESMLKRSRAELEQVKADNKTLNATILKLEDCKLKLEVALKECRAENSEPKSNDKERLENELKEIKAELEKVKKENKSLKAELYRGVKIGNPLVYFDMTFNGAPVGTIVMELYADISPRIVEIFRALCVGEKVLPGTDKLVSYKGTSISLVHPGLDIYGGDVKVKNRAEFESIYGHNWTTEITGRGHRGPGDLMLHVVYDIQQLGKNFSFIIFGSKGQGLIGQFPVIGRVIMGMDVVEAKNLDIRNVLMDEGTFVISDCGQIS